MGIYDALKDAGTILKEAGKIEQYAQILEVQEKLLEMQKVIAELEGQNKELKERLDTKGKLVAKDNMYWLKSETGMDGPYCTGCWDSGYKLIRLHLSTNGAASCPACKVFAKHGNAFVVHQRDLGNNSAR